MVQKYSPLISVIVPIYNREKTIDVCIRSILASIYSNIELILVDDGSSDRSSEICQNYCDKDSRVRFISQENGGVSKARNTGFKAAKGEWISFVDSDDAIMPEYYQSMIEAGIENCELTMTGRCPGIKEDGIIRRKMNPVDTIKKHIKGNTNIVNFIFGDFNPYNKNFYNSTNKLFRRSILVDNELMHKEGITLGEDQIFVLDYFKYVNHFYYDSTPCYLFFDWDNMDKTYGLGSQLRTPDYFQMVHRENYAAFERLYALCNDQELKKYEVNYVLDRPISKILFQYTLLSNLKLFDYSRLKDFTKSEILPFLDKERANIDMLVDSRIAYYVKALFQQPFALVYVQLLFTSNMLYYKKKAKLRIKRIIKRILGRK